MVERYFSDTMVGIWFSSSVAECLVRRVSYLGVLLYTTGAREVSLARQSVVVAYRVHVAARLGHRSRGWFRLGRVPR